MSHDPITPAPRLGVSLLRRARIAQGWSLEDAAARVRACCTGPTDPDTGCRVDADRLQQFETGLMHPGPGHIQILADLYQQDATELALPAWTVGSEPQATRPAPETALPDADAQSETAHLEEGMEQHTNEQSAPEPGRKRRRRAPRRRWSDPASPLQAARFARRQSGREIVKAFRELCPGHAGEKCRFEISKLSDYENRARRPSVTHIETFCRLYQKSPEKLGLITWRDDPPTQPEAAAPTEHDDAAGQGSRAREQLVLDWLRDSAISISSAVVGALTRCPITLTEDDLRRVIRELLHASHDHSEEDASDEDAPDAPSQDATVEQPSRPAPHHNGVAEPVGLDFGVVSQAAEAEAAGAPHPETSEATE